VDKMMEEFQGKNILITGASKGLGYVCAKAFEGTGARLVITARSSDKLEKLRNSFSDPSKHLVFEGDLAYPKNIEALVNKGLEHTGGFDIVLHVLGGGYGFRDPLLTWDQLETLHKVNVGVAAEINRLVAPEMVAKRSGRLVHVGSIASQEATASVGYNTVKSALAAYVRSLGRELAESGVVVSGILPGAFNAPENSWRRLEINKPEVVKEFTEKNLPRKRIADADEVLPLVFFLASESASMMSGCCVPIDAGEGKSYVV
jgi:3-oxoacyl-[acyl-carrier protein] reductase